MGQSPAKRGADGQLAALVDELRKAVIFGQFRPRERLIEEELTERFGVSRHLLRNAFAELDHMGLVERRPNRGVIVRDFSLDELEELFEMRALLQMAAARRIPAPPPPALLAALRAINADYLAAVEKADKETASQLNTTFHDTLFRACGNRFLAESISHFWLRTTPIHWYTLGNSDHMRRSHADHERMIAALERGDRESLAELCRTHSYLALAAYKQVHASSAGSPPGPPVAVA